MNCKKTFYLTYRPLTEEQRVSRFEEAFIFYKLIALNTLILFLFLFSTILVFTSSKFVHRFLMVSPEKAVFSEGDHLLFVVPIRLT